MTKTITQLTILAIVLLLAQVICSKIMLWGVAMPVVFIYVLLRLPIGTPKGWTFTIAFFLGLVVDVFNNTAGMNALAATLMMGLRKPVFYLYVLRDDDLNSPLPSTESIGAASYLKYMVTLVIIFCALLFFIQAFTLRDFPLTLLRIGASSVLTAVLLFAIDSLMSARREERL